jgi:hypothetical protein
VNGCNTYGEDCDGNNIYKSVPPEGYQPPLVAKWENVPNGTVLVARCWTVGGTTTNYATTDPGPSPYSSTVYYEVQASGGQWGYIPDTYFVRDKAGHLGLRYC